jgi:ABC-type Fe3+/spermidine/putrescine transport system ATPase subunit
LAGVRLEHLHKTFGAQVVLDIDELDVRDGEFFSLLGPSGCGKTTTLRSVAGLVEPDRGRIVIGGRDMRGVPTFRRNLGMVFQKYALFPHLTVGENVSYGLEERGVGRSEIDRSVAESLSLVALAHCEDRYPHQLSGGQQQRVAMARAVVYRPDVLLLDEPLSNLDVKLRVAMRAELKRLQQALGITTLFVTHDQHEALALSDRIAVMREGRIEQLGTPEEIYQYPRSLFVADFVGSTNLLDGVVHAVDTEAGTVVVRIGDRLVTAKTTHRMTAGSAIRVAVKPERVALSSRAGQRAGDTGGLPGEIESVAYLGSFYSYIVAIGSQRIEARSAEPIVDDGTPAGAGAIVEVRFSPESTRVFAA